MKKGENFCFCFSKCLPERIAALLILLIFVPVIIVLSCISIIHFWKFPIYCQRRGLSLHSNQFTIYKIRTLNCMTRENSNEITLKRELSGRLTKYNQWLRRTGLDELPQLLNILLGEMNFIGPRPLSINDLRLLEQLFPQLYIERKELKLKPGITGLWQIFGKRENGIQEMIRLDSYYQKNKSLKLNTKIVIVTVVKILTAGKSDAADYKSISAEKIKLIHS